MMHFLPLTLDERYLDSVIDHARKMGVEAVHLSHRLVHNADDVLDDSERADKVRRFVAAARHAGLDVWCWTHEFHRPPANLLDDQGRLRCDHPELSNHLKEKYAQLCESVLPGLSGVVLTFAECQFPVYQDHRVRSDRSRSVRVAHLVDQMIQALAPFGVQLAVRDFVYRRGEVKTMREAISGLPGDVAVMSKAVPHDWHPDYPSNPLIGAFQGRRQWVEHDLGFEYEGQHVLPYANLATIDRRIRHERGLGIARWCLRLDRYSGNHDYSALSTPWGNIAIEAAQATMLGHCPGSVIEAWESRHFSGAAAWLREATDCVRQTLFPRGQWYANHSNLPTWGYASSHLCGGNADRLAAWTEDPADAFCEQAMAKMPSGWARTMIAEGDIQTQRARALAAHLHEQPALGPQSGRWSQGAALLTLWAECFAAHRRAYFLICERQTRPNAVAAKEIEDALAKFEETCLQFAPDVVDVRIEEHQPDCRPAAYCDRGERLEITDNPRAWRTVVASLAAAAARLP